jgi:CheY-like chemotaxis protein
MQGDLRCVSEVGKGSCFTFTVPLPIAARPEGAMAASAAAEAETQAHHQAEAADTQPSEPPVAATSHASSARPAQGPSRSPQPLHGKVLLVEDNAVNAMVAEAAIAHLGLEVVLATDGQEALDLLVPGPHGFDLVLMDCQMPVLDGIEATRRLRVHEQDIGSPNVPVIALTANATPHDRQRCAAAGMDDHLAKPFKQEELAAMLRQHLVSHALTA